MTPRENYLRAVRFERPEHIPMNFHINPACWNSYDQHALLDLMEAHPLLFPGIERQEVVRPDYGANQLADTPYTDPWGCVWTTSVDGITGSVHSHPLESWDSFSEFRAPDPSTTDGTFPVDWEELARDVEAAKENGDLVVGGLPHGHTFLRLQDIRGYENVVFDMADDRPELRKLISMVAEVNLGVVKRWLELEPDVISYAEDLGMQVGPMLSPDHFVKYIKPIYRTLMQPALESGSVVHMHSDGDIRTLASDLIDAGVEVVNLQDLVNGIDWIRDTFAGRVCIDLDIDRQSVTAHGTPDEIDRLIRREIESLGSPQGGLMMVFGLYPGSPLENVEAVMDAMERYATYYD